MDFTNSDKVHFQLSSKALIKKAIDKREGKLTSNGALVVKTGRYTGRSPQDKFIVKEETTSQNINWNSFNKPFTEEQFDKLYEKVTNYLKNKEIFIFDGFEGADKEHQISIRTINEFAWHNLFMQHLLIKPSENDYKHDNVDFTIINAPKFKANPKVFGTNSEAFIIINFKKKIILIGGTEYAGEMQKAIFSVMNYILPMKGILPVHSAAIENPNGEVTLLFGFSGTGKTTLSSTSNHFLIADDEIVWTDNGIFNIENGCYVKCHNISKEKESEIISAIRDGAIIENITIDERDKPNFKDKSLTENSRAAYPISHLNNAKEQGIGKSPTTIIFLTNDLNGVLPPISKLTKEQAIYHFLVGYTSKSVGIERGIIEPVPTFSSCFGEDFLLLKPNVYVKLFADKIEEHNPNVFLVNTGWIGDSQEGGKRIELEHTRSIVSSIINGFLNKIEYEKDSIFNLDIPKDCPNIPFFILNPQNIWENQELYFKKGNALKKSLQEQFEMHNFIIEFDEEKNPTETKTEFITNEKTLIENEEKASLVSLSYIEESYQRSLSRRKIKSNI